MGIERRRGIQRRSSRRKKLGILKRRAASANPSEKNVLANKLRQMTPGADAIIERLALEFEGGLGVLTGETGSGKSILLDALGLACGNRADAQDIGAPDSVSEPGLPPAASDGGAANPCAKTRNAGSGC